MEKIFIKPECNKFACPFFEKCCKCAAELVKMRVADNHIDIMFVGQGAGAEEDQTGKPFQGRAGRLLRGKVKPLLVERKLNIILDNTIRCRPLDNLGKNRAPTDKEVEHCIDFLYQNIQTFNPKVIVPLGASATGTLIPSLKKVPISKSRGKEYSVMGHPVIPTFHPAAILHAKEEETKVMLETTMTKDITTITEQINSERMLI